VTFVEAGQKIVAQLADALHAEAEAIMRESLQECPISGPETYDTDIRNVDGKLVKFRDPLDPEGAMVGDHGVLRRSARVFAPVTTTTEVSVLMGYGFGSEVNQEGRIAAAYAVPVHEILSAKHAPPTKAKYLEDPLFEHASHLGESLARDISIEGVAPTAILGDAMLTGEDLGA
jgi:hypothetical protein